MPTSLAPAKVNLFLHVGEVQTNGRHPLDSLVVFAGPEAADRVSALPADGLSLDITGPRAEGLEVDEGNLVLRAAYGLLEASGERHGAALTLDKLLPVAAGIGGGSADAGATLRLLQDLWSLDAELVQRVAVPLGGDVPVALVGRTALMQGEGERVLPQMGLPTLPAVLVNPGVDCPTGAVFRAFDAAGAGAGFSELPRVPRFETATTMIDWLESQRNDLEPVAIDLVPAIGKVLAVLSEVPGTRLSRMSGSGATCFALFDTREAAEAAAAELATGYPDWWVRATELGDAV